MADDVDQGGEAPCWAHLAEDLDQHFAPLRIVGSNTILYSGRWAELVDFYRNGLGLRTSMERDWFIEFELHPGAHISVADAKRASIACGDGAGMTLSWRVDDAHEVRGALARNGIDASPIQNRWGSPGFFVFDPAGNRIEFWSDSI
jgi:catechol 2,3-dioxygenase-like lactoylglutathione lyase family enzyme